MPYVVTPYQNVSPNIKIFSCSKEAASNILLSSLSCSNIFLIIGFKIAPCISLTKLALSGNPSWSGVPLVSLTVERSIVKSSKSVISALIALILQLSKVPPDIYLTSRPSGGPCHP